MITAARHRTVAALVPGGGRRGPGRGNAVAVPRIRRIDREDGTVRLRPTGATAARDSCDIAGSVRPEKELSMIHT